VRFAKDIPTDLAATIGNRLARLEQKAVVVVHRDATIVGLVDPTKWTHSRAKSHRPAFLPVGNREVLLLSEKVWTAPDVPPQITVSDTGISIGLLDPRATVEPQV